MITNRFSVAITNAVTNAINGNGGLFKKKFHLKFILSNAYAYGMFSFVCGI